MNELLIKMNPDFDDPCKRSLTLPEEFFLLLIDKVSGKIPKSVVPLFYGFIGVGIAELLLIGKLTMEKQNGAFNIQNMNVKVIDFSPTQDEFLNYVLSKIAKRKTPTTISRNILYIGNNVYQKNLKRVNNTIAKSLMKKNILTVSETMKNLFGTRYSYNILDLESKNNIEMSCCKLISGLLNSSQQPEGLIRETILLLTLKQYTYVTSKPLISDFLERNYPINQHKQISDCIKILESTIKSPKLDDPIHKMLNLIMTGIRGAFDSD
ncbi:Golgi phosphoprotein 3 family protein [Tieghemostelium lacteum]|uniref:Golgi phosphoprotein 3 family protein n=1 Tax=Tieghemostelium lacteum TaxID=361077 RepID=A0A152A271_TIELA|nr:Golgi phosphoprotein 3 family protein [Tieghemostelium lacteum]|eukprot:KYR00353.1 Golgi phosphoprotein 3 family protein [Tieghemostelium lacteum]